MLHNNSDDNKYKYVIIIVKNDDDDDEEEEDDDDDDDGDDDGDDDVDDDDADDDDDDHGPHIYIYILKVHRHGISKIRNPPAIQARSNVRVAPNMFQPGTFMCYGQRLGSILAQTSLR